MAPNFLTGGGVCRLVIALVLFLPAQSLFARGGSRLRWGYQPPAGNPTWNLWNVASPWAAMNGWGIPHHNLDAPRLGPGYTAGSFDGGSRAPQLDRSVEFPGASSNPTLLLPSTARPAPAGPYRTEKRFEPPYYHNYDGYWHHGYWGGGLWGWARWGGPLGIAGFSRWPTGPVYYTSGYGIYRNPFVAGQKVPLVAFLDYAKPIENIQDDEEPSAGSTASEAPASTDGDATEETPEEIRNYLVKSPEVKAGLKSFDAASEAFQKKNYELALEKTDEALTKLPYDAAIHEFRALILVERKDYQQAAATIYAVLSVSPGWDWTTLSSRYFRPERIRGRTARARRLAEAEPRFRRGGFSPRLSLHDLPALRGRRQSISEGRQTASRRRAHTPPGKAHRARRREKSTVLAACNRAAGLRR